ncbi:MAG TPA: AAA family ATPase [Solirubrobacteraceae bacterium]|nr:AAA family ATPase [Solirubrobacteraceae bacterium]
MGCSADGGLVERAAELDRVRECIDAAAAGRGSLVLIEGVAGIGKTSVLRHACTIAAHAGCGVRFAAAGPLERDLGWNIVRQLFADVARADDAERERLLAGVNGLAAPALGLAAGSDAGALHGLYWLTADIAGASPLLLAVDDAQWADPASLSYLTYLVPRLNDLGVLVAVTVRSGEEQRSAELRALSGGRATVIGLRAMSAAATATLTRSALGDDAAAAFCEACHNVTGGNPFLLHELLEQLRRDRIQPSEESAAQVNAVRPETVTRSVLLRLSTLSEAARALANAVAILGDEGVLAQAATLAELDRADAIAAADELAGADILDAALRFVHPIVQETVLAELSALVQAYQHDRAARMLVEQRAPAERVGVHLLHTEPAGDPWVVERLREAAAAALASGAPVAAATYLERALHEPPPPPNRGLVLFELGAAQARTDLGGVQRIREALELTAEPHTRAEMMLLLGSTVGLAGDHEQAADVLHAALNEPHDDGALRVSIDAELAGHCLHASSRLGLAFERLGGVRLHRAASGSAEHALRVIAAHALICSGQLDAGAAREVALAAADSALVETGGLSQALFVAELLVYADELEAAIAVLDRRIAHARAHGSSPGVALASAFRAQAELRRGAVLRAETDARTALEVLDSEFLGYCRPYVLSFMIDVLVELDRLHEAESLLELAGPRPNWPQLWQHALLTASEARLRAAKGDHMRAAETALECGRRLAPWRPRNPTAVPWRSLAALASARVGEREEAIRLAESELAHARAMAPPRALGVALRTSGLVHGGDPGIALLRESVTVLEGSVARLEHARALVDLGAALRRSGQRADAREPLRAGLDGARRCGARALARRARDELVAAGARPRGPVDAEPELLTPSESRVARLAADGRTNREIAQALFVSLRTVETHLTHVYQKLDIGSRAQLPGALAARVPTPVSGPSATDRPRVGRDYVSA